MGNNFNLPAPPWFRGLQPDLPIQVYRRNLPHWRQEGATYMVTFHLADALPRDKQHFLRRLREEWELTKPADQSENDWKDFAGRYTRSAERWLDAGSGVCYFQERRWSLVLQERLFTFHEQRYFLGSFAIMPNHCHALIKPFVGHALEDLLGGIKGVCARIINREHGRTGSLWQEESYDRIIRDEEHLWNALQYIGRNPRMAGLSHQNSWRRWISPLWDSAGWRFRD